MENIGALALLLAFCISLYAIVSSVVGRLRKKPFLTLSAERAVLAVWVLVATASTILVYSLMTGDFRMAYVASHTNRDMPAFYKFAAWWGGQEGSLLFWSWILSTYGAVVVLTNRSRHRALMPWVLAILSTVQVFFLTLNAFVVSPFQVLAVQRHVACCPAGNAGFFREHDDKVAQQSAVPGVLCGNGHEFQALAVVTHVEVPCRKGIGDFSVSGPVNAMEEKTLFPTFQISWRGR